MPRQKKQKKAKYVPTESDLIPSDEYHTDDSFNESQRQRVTSLTRKDRLEEYQTTLKLLEAQRDALPPLLDNRGRSITLSRFQQKIQAQSTSAFIRMQKQADKKLGKTTRSEPVKPSEPPSRKTMAKSKRHQKEKEEEEESDFNIDDAEDESSEDEEEPPKKPVRRKGAATAGKFDRFSHKKVEEATTPASEKKRRGRGSASRGRGRGKPRTSSPAKEKDDFADFNASMIDWTEGAPAGENTPAKKREL